MAVSQKIYDESWIGQNPRLTGPKILTHVASSTWVTSQTETRRQNEANTFVLTLSITYQ